MDAWQTVWVCTVFTIVVMLLDAWSASRVSGDLADQVRQDQRKRRMSKLAINSQNMKQGSDESGAEK